MEVVQSYTEEDFSALMKKLELESQEQCRRGRLIRGWRGTMEEEAEIVGRAWKDI
jgi:hypothetical protein